MKRSSDLYLNDILEAIRRIEEYTQSMGVEDFGKNKLVLDAVMRNLEVIGEAATQVPQALKDKFKFIPWRDIQDFRIVVAHKYWSVNTERISKSSGSFL